MYRSTALSYSNPEEGERDWRSVLSLDDSRGRNNKETDPFERRRKIQRALHEIDDVLLAGNEVMILVGAGLSAKYGYPLGSDAQKEITKLAGTHRIAHTKFGYQLPIVDGLSSPVSWEYLVSKYKAKMKTRLDFLSWFNAIDERVLAELTAPHRPAPEHLILLALAYGDWNGPSNLGLWFSVFLHYENRCPDFANLPVDDERWHLEFPRFDPHVVEPADETSFPIRGKVDLVTTNWDRLFEKTIDDWFYPRIDDDSENPSDVRSERHSAEQLFDKIHGSPTFWTCNKCSGSDRMFTFPTHRIRIKGELYCRVHQTRLKPPSILMPSESLDRARSKIWKSVLQKAKRCKVLLLLGVGGNDRYIIEDLIQPISDRTYAVKRKLDLTAAGNLERVLGADRVLDVDAGDFLHALVDYGVGTVKKALWHEYIMEQPEYEVPDDIREEILSDAEDEYLKAGEDTYG